MLQRPTSDDLEFEDDEDDVPEAPSRGGFSETAFQTTIQDLISQKKNDAAVKYIISNLPKLHDSNLNIKEKINNLYFASRVIQTAGGLKYGPNKLLTKIRALNQNLKDIALPLGGGFVELGCGAHDPIALSTYFFVNGYAPNYAVDLLPPRVPHFSAYSMYDILCNIRMYPGRYCRDATRPKDVLDRLRELDTQSFERGSFQEGLQSLDGKVNLELVDIVKSRIPQGSISLLASFAVFEHVDDIETVSRHIYKLLKPGGVAYHFVDLADHRSYRGDGAYGPLSFLTEEEAPANMNRLRAPQIRQAQIDAGFEVLKDRRVNALESSAIEASLVERFRSMPFKDVSVVKQYLVVRKPGDA